MTAPDPQSILASLGLSPDTATPVPDDDFWTRLLDVAFDPATPPADPSLVPTMDDDGPLFDDPTADPDDLPSDLSTTDHDDPSGSEHPDHHAAADGGHHDPADGTTPDADSDHHTAGDDGHHDPGAWHE